MVAANEPWPDWPELSFDTAEKPPENAQIKKDIAAQYGEAALRKSWTAVCNKLNSLTRELAAKQDKSIPEIAYDDFFQLSEEGKQKLRDVGCFVIRGTIPKEKATAWFDDVNQYYQDNKASISGWPAETPYILKLYWSRTQMEARTHPRAMALHRALNELWHDASDADKKFAEPLVYADAVRIRPPGVPFRGLGPHIDAGSLSRWAEPEYRDVYEPVWAGHPEDCDPYDLGLRKKANPRFFDGSAHASVLRLWQGWTALTEAGPNEGSLMLYPDVKTSVAYVLLRPFFQPPANTTTDDADYLNPDKWTFETSSPCFPGVWRQDSQLLSPTLFPHLRLKDCLVHIPRMYPGDTVWWHCDMCHAVEVDHKGPGIASVVYVGATPTTDINLTYVREQLDFFLKGQPPQDFQSGGCNESALKGYPGPSTTVLNGDVGRKALGFAV